MSGCLIALLVVLGLFVVGVIGFVVVAGFFVSQAADEIDDAVGEYSDAQEEMEVIEEETGIETNSANLDHPPQYDLGETVDCDLDGRSVVASGTVTNRSSEASDYAITVVFEQDDGTRSDEAQTWLNRVEPEEQARWEVVAFSTPDAGEADVTDCRVSLIDRFSVDPSLEPDGFPGD